MHLFRALAIQLVSWIVAVFALRYTVTPPAGIGAIVVMQAGIAAAFALTLKAPRWWVVIHLLFSPLVVGGACALMIWLTGREDRRDLGRR